MKEEIKSKFRLVLASQSPRRKELLAYLRVPFEIIPSETDEIIQKGLGYGELVSTLAFQKANDVFNKLQDESVISIGSDTLVVLGSDILGKPKNRLEGKSFLNKLSESTHQVFTGVSIVGKNKTRQFFNVTDVTFGKIDPSQLELYLDSGEYADKAGAYGIQGMGLSFIKEIKGSYSNVVGFPLYEFYNEFLNYLNLSEDNWRDAFE